MTKVVITAELTRKTLVAKFDDGVTLQFSETLGGDVISTVQAYSRDNVTSAQLRTIRLNFAKIQGTYDVIDRFELIKARCEAAVNISDLL